MSCYDKDCDYPYCGGEDHAGAAGIGAGRFFVPQPPVGGVVDAGLGKVEAATRDNPAIWKSGAKRSAPKPEWSLMPWNALREVLRRFEVGKKYGVHNWKKAQTSDDVDYVRQFDAHSFEHYRAFLNLIDKPADAVSEKGDNLVENLAAAVWNQLTLLDYLLENEGLVRAALSRYAEGDPRRFDAPVSTAECAAECRGFEATTDNSFICRNCGSHYGNHQAEDSRKQPDTTAPVCGFCAYRNSPHRNPNVEATYVCNNPTGSEHGLRGEGKPARLLPLFSM